MSEATSATTTTIRQLSDGNPDGNCLGQSATDPISFYGATPAVQPSGATQAALTDSTGGTAAATTGLSAVSVKQTITIPVTLAGLANSQTLKLALPFSFTLNSLGFRTAAPVTTASKAATLQASISGAACTGGAISLTSANQAAAGTLTAASAITAGGTGAEGGTLEVVVSSVTAFVEGDGWVEANVTNWSAANALATLAQLQNKLRADLVTLGAVKGSA
jgi:hypothetical protein